MNAKDIVVTLEPRVVVGKTVKHLRHQGLIPAVIHDHGKDSIIVMGQSVMLAKAFQEAGKHHPLELKVGSETYMALIKDVDIEPTKHQMRHVVFNAINRNEKTEAEIPVRLEGDIPAEKLSLLVLQSLDHVEVEALPKDLPDELTVDAAKLAEVGDAVTVADIVLPPGVALLTDPTTPIAHVEEPRVQAVEEPEPTATEEEAAAATSEEE